MDLKRDIVTKRSNNKLSLFHVGVVMLLAARGCNKAPFSECLPHIPHGCFQGGTYRSCPECRMSRGAIKATSMGAQGSVVRGTVKVSDRVVVHMMICLFILDSPLEFSHLV